MLSRLPLLLLLAALAPALVACGGGGDEPQETGASPTAPDASPTETDGIEAAPGGWQRCTNDLDGWTADFPPGWHTNQGMLSVGDCRLFDPEPVELTADDATIPPDLGVHLWAFTVLGSFDEAVDDPLVEELDRRETTVDGRRAYRLELEQREEGLVPPGTRTVRYVVDMGGHRVLFGMSNDIGAPAFEDKVEALDEMMTRLRFLPPPADLP